MTIESIWNYLATTLSAVPRSGLLLLVVAAIAFSMVGSLMVRRQLPLGQLVRRGSTVVLAGVLLLVVLQLSRFDSRLEVAVPQIGLPEQVVEGGETRIPMAPDGHFWLRAELNGVQANFLVDTGATLTAVSQGLADRAALEPRRGGLPVTINTANGPVGAQLATVSEIRFGNVVARGLDVVIAPTLGETNVIGMNLLSRLASWRVEQNTMILVPNDLQPEPQW
ncbi:TIGR02281 family clan AA aspartic protease [Altererythrobacter sp. BO-6]|uniref:retropepsin-like aspartic protease family protein n=1 Tax=Altererythrobacter sp. BO-6 TaxID=2604537 RepID=UPI0013E1A679|nr:TIGR02281 family clan AA aspartic protease [Altererythrobacter sp. BO-6]QIG55063.1 TIGR02281 family clan AA aspartic protease [Altererythrobacter sp. BO-6]